nr:hypothetical protein [uncultured Flavobacterium sp.]
MYNEAIEIARELKRKVNSKQLKFKTDFTLQGVASIIENRQNIKIEEKFNFSAQVNDITKEILICTIEIYDTNVFYKKELLCIDNFITANSKLGLIFNVNDFETDIATKKNLCNVIKDTPLIRGLLVQNYKIVNI